MRSPSIRACDSIAIDVDNAACGRDSIPSALGTDAVEQAGVIVGDDETTVWSDHHAGGTAPAFATGILPTGDEIARRDRYAVLEVDEQELRRGRWLSVPGPVLGDDEIAIEIAWNSFPFEEGETKWRRVSLDADGRWHP